MTTDSDTNELLTRIAEALERQNQINHDLAANVADLDLRLTSIKDALENIANSAAAV